eukprot:TRINITY_DN3271_c0_g1_i2.p1 TRINITY_DN3271_c0_g1~~TRINITY_DN3271_c0_g1_i2.p1  ORF type:complete len:214 (-),score=47.96 TRINITY_DN3271_c0_g1_i2:89-637(-)
MASASLALKRLTQEYKRILSDPPPGAAAAPASDNNMFVWNAVIMGPPDTEYSGGAFCATLTFPSSYPMQPPKMKFTTPMWHPNIFPSGEVCISILHPPGEDPRHYESAVERWTPVQSIEKILVSVISMLAEPNCESPANLDAAKLWTGNRAAFREKVRQTVDQSHQVLSSHMAALAKASQQH